MLQQSLLTEMISIFRRYWDQKLETVAYWYGLEFNSEKVDVVLSLVVPKAEHFPGHYNVPVEETTRMGNAMLDRGLVCLAQVHTHPDLIRYHSDYDDKNSLSMRDHFLSIVVTNYGRVTAHDLKEFNVHESFKNSWHILNDEQKMKRIKVVDDLVDLRISDL